jgi:hypothetical protein
MSIATEQTEHQEHMLFMFDPHVSASASRLDLKDFFQQQRVRCEEAITAFSVEQLTGSEEAIIDDLRERLELPALVLKPQQARFVPCQQETILFKQNPYYPYAKFRVKNNNGAISVPSKTYCFRLDIPYRGSTETLLFCGKKAAGFYNNQSHLLLLNEERCVLSLFVP